MHIHHNILNDLINTVSFCYPWLPTSLTSLVFLAFFLGGDFTVFAVFVLFLPLVYFNRLMDFWMAIIFDFTKSHCPSDSFVAFSCCNFTYRKFLKSNYLQNE